MSEDTVPENPMGIFYTGDFEGQLRECLFKKVGSEASSLRFGYVSTKAMFDCDQVSENLRTLIQTGAEHCRVMVWPGQIPQEVRYGNESKFFLCKELFMLLLQ